MEITNPTLTLELNSEITSLETWAAMFSIETDSDRQATIETIRICKEKRNAIVEFFADSKAKAHAAWKSIVANEKTFTDKLDFVERTARDAINKYDRAEEEKRLAEQRRLQAIADEAARKERLRLQAEAAKATSEAEKQRKLEAAKTVAAPVVVAQPAPVAAAGTTARKIWKARIVDANQIPREFLMVNEKALDAFAKTTKGTQKIAGVEFYQDNILAVR